MSPANLVKVAAAERTADVVAGSLTFSWGRSSLDSQPDATTVALVLDTDADPGLGDPVEVAVHDPDAFSSPSTHRVFLGYITDLSVEVTDTGERFVSVMAADPVAVLNDVLVGDQPWPAEPVGARAGRIGDLAAAQMGWAYPVDAGGLGVWGVQARDVDSQRALGLLHDLADSSDAVLFFDPGYDTALYPEAPRFRFVDRSVTLSGPRTWELEVSPRTYRSKGNVVNMVRVGYGSADPQAAVTRQDDASIAAHLRRYRYIGTELAAQADAAALAQATLDRLAWPLWQQTGATFSSANAYEWQYLARLQDPRTVIRARSAADRDTLAEWRVLSGQLRLWHDQWDVTLDLQEVPA